ncbi:hypothetical protein [Stakelama tenebrarum]|uniref:Uncharacterized protein n=1 Tax=Stakelama tenebrarum TaxID=2711215 RepID=A0A6G6Y9D5_9SPHN|nr:hypothetical protein [Sphingosinithalassobacter tenebrarum]QIG81417.1 hypothetical protein G5C33_17560 [Sphingosinithalassobacter tenebrarum]
MIFPTLMALLIAQEAPIPVTLEIGFDGGQCTVVSDEERFPLDELSLRTAAWARDGRPVEIHGLDSVPEQCGTGIVFELQRAGITRIEEVREAEPLALTMAAGAPCHVLVGGQSLAIEELPVLLTAAREAGLHLVLESETGVAYECADRVMRTVVEIWQDAPLRIVANEE